MRNSRLFAELTLLFNILVTVLTRVIKTAFKRLIVSEKTGKLEAGITR